MYVYIIYYYIQYTRTKMKQVLETIYYIVPNYHRFIINVYFICILLVFTYIISFMHICKTR